MSKDERPTYQAIIDLLVERGLTIKQAYDVLIRTRWELDAYKKGYDDDVAIAPKLSDVLQATPFRFPTVNWD
jgi:hypothetical protein